MVEYSGKSVYEGIAIGPLKAFTKKEKVIPASVVIDIEAEKNKFFEAREKASNDLDYLYNEALKSVSRDSAEIFNMHKTMVNDLDLEDLVIENINQGYNACLAVKESCSILAKMFLNMDDEYFKNRSSDCYDISNRLTDILLGITSDYEVNTPAILSSYEFNPSDLVKIDKKNILGFVSTVGSNNSHTAILARTMGIPAIVNTKISIEEDMNDKLTIIDGFNGKIIIDPTEDVLKVYNERKEKLDEQRKRREALIGKENITIDGYKLNVFSNIGKSKDADLAIQNDAGGIGLFRSEFLYLESTDYPTEDFQFEEYKKVLEKMKGKLVVIRTMDVGADKQASYFNLPHEDNPALGLRSLRICFERPEIMYTQLRALYRASVYGKLAIMVPMIISVEEVLWVKEMAEKVKFELKNQNIPYDENVELGIMIETPAACLISDDLAKVCDFFSVGTNDLTQYTLAMDRQNQSLEKLYNPHHKAILRAIKMAADNIHKEGKWIGICGELGRDLNLTEYFLGIKIDELSVSPSYVLPLREKIRSINTKDIDLAKYI